MNLKNSNRNKDSFSDSFKPARILNSVTLDQMLNQVFLDDQFEEYNSSGHQLIYNNLDRINTPSNPDLKSVYTLETNDPNAQPIIRQVTVKGKAAFGDGSYLVETKANGRGVAIVMMQEVPSQNQVYYNIRLLPYSTLKDILVNASSEFIEVQIPRSNVVKLNITLMSSRTGETVYKTHKTEVNLENTTEDQQVQLLRFLEFDGAQIAAHFVNLVLQLNPNMDSATAATFQLDMTNAEKKELLLVLALTSTLIGGGVGTIGSIATFGFFSWQTAAAFFASLGGVLRNSAGFIPTDNAPQNQNQNQNQG